MSNDASNADANSKHYYIFNSLVFGQHGHVESSFQYT